MSSEMNRSEVVRALEAERRRWEALLAQVGDDRLTEALLPGGWSFKDLIAHLTAWQRLTVARLEAALRDQKPPVPPWPPDWNEEENVDAINDRFLQQNRDRPAGEVVAEWRRVFQAVIDLTQSLP